MLGLDEATKVAKLIELFEECGQLPSCLLFLDGLEMLIGMFWRLENLKLSPSPGYFLLTSPRFKSENGMFFVSTERVTETEHHKLSLTGV